MTRNVSVRSVIDAWSSKPFSYGEDCCQFVGACIESITGENPAKQFTYSTESEAREIISAHSDLYGLFSSLFGEPASGPFQDGDVTVHDMTNNEQIAGVIYRGRAVVRTRTGLVDWPIESAKAVWSV